MSLQDLFKILEALRRDTEVTIAEAAWLVGVTGMTYKTWRKGGEPHTTNHQGLQFAIDVLTQGTQQNLLPVDGPAKVPAVIEKRQEVLINLVAQVGG